MSDQNSAAAPALAPVCATCGQSLTASSEPTREAAHPVQFFRTDSKPGPFPPGTLLAKRYRIVALLGSGGTGEVYRADDLTLDQAVALKFYPARVQAEPGTMARFHREVRLARQISHPNICRVFDIGETEGRAFITMEFVSGEDLHSLLRRIGRLAPDKALEVALQLCSGLTAAHAAGVLHRDLKPANIMLDDRGNVRITDFGLAALADELHHEMDAGTPGYMAPEQLAAKEVTARSDLYALGLVLFEIFTGKRHIEPQRGAELLRPKPAPVTPANFVGVDPWVTQAIVRCLDPDPARRPESAMHVAAALARRAVPAADAITHADAAQEAGPTSAATDGPRFRLGWSLVMANLFGFAMLLLLAPRSTGQNLVFDMKSPQDSLGAVFTWLWSIALQSFLVLLSMAYLLRSGSRMASRPSGARHDK